MDFQAIIELPDVRNRAKERISVSFSLAKRLSNQPSNKFDIEIASYPLAVMLAAGTEEPKLIERFALFEAQQVNLYLEHEKREEIILEIAKAFKWQVKTEGDITWVHFTKFLESTSRGRLIHNPKWKLVNRSLDKGWVVVTEIELARLLQEEVMKRIESSAKQKVNGLPEEIQKDIEELRAEFLKARPNLEEFDKMVHAQESEYPPCITNFMKRASQGRHLSHTERFTLVTYLIHQGISVDSIVSLFSNIADFNEGKTRYQVENLAGKSGGRTEPYVTYNCSTLQTHGVCIDPIDPICRTIRNPLTYHLRKQRINQQKATSTIA